MFNAWRSVAPNPPLVIICDVNETLIDLEVIGPLFKRVFGHGCVVRDWFNQLIFYSDASRSEDYVPFFTLGESVFKMPGSGYRVNEKSAG